MISLPFIALFLAVPAAWTSAARWLVPSLLAVIYFAAFANGQLTPLAAIPLALLLVAAFAVGPHRQAPTRYVGHALFIVLAAALSMHWLPGFHNPRVIGPERFTADALPFTMYLNLDKPLVCFWLLLALPWMRPRNPVLTSIQAGTVGMAATTIVCLFLALLLGTVRWEPKWPTSTWLFMLNNLLLVTVTEETLFRGYIQGGLSRLLRHLAHADIIALGIASIVFGLAHYSGGWQWIVLASIAGLGYGLAYRFGGLSAAILTHFGLNAAHFLLFTYPMLQAPGAS
ncbi:CPBP family intramembrane glutamic endopeptidase [Paraburkholderia strydomiana]|uniref:CPBP family intramembrane glutamic endopeptidase n=1 Tax=Paraburkholderia strydomiana TaxID=1245417 RepID=UPI00285FFA5D|nr:CPBP family intramembrane glutamic endopeptidase [Paraburkholderia strydomiana]MDR7006197.1 membrane protease YdiL (CAAX protease family) [Paraburkholderia strydomiana]